MRFAFGPGLVFILLAACEGAPTAPADDARDAVVALKAGGDATCALTESGKLRCWGYSGVSSGADSVPQEVPGSLIVADFAVANGFGGAVCASPVGGGTYCWGDFAGWYDVYGPYPGFLQDTLPLSGLASGDGHACGIAPDGSANCWGSSLAGKRGEGTPALEAPNLTINRVAGDLQFTALAAERFHTCGLTTNMNVYCWGVGDRLGDTLATSFDDDCFMWASCAWAPVPVRSLGSVRALAVGDFESCAILQSGTVWCWQALPPWDGTKPGFPSLVTLPERVSQVAVGGVFTCALGLSGKVYCWGEHGPWRGTDDLSAVTEVTTALRFTSLSTGNRHACGIDREGAPYCWGDNFEGQLGDRTHTDASHPVRVALSQ